MIGISPATTMQRERDKKKPRLIPNMKEYVHFSSSVNNKNQNLTKFSLISRFLYSNVIYSTNFFRL